MRSRAVLSIGSLISVFGCASGCHNREPLELLVVHRLEPERASAGDRVVVTGEGFPEGRAAAVTFRGDLLRPGAPRQTDVRIVAQAVPAERGSVAVAFDRAMERRFAGSGGAALHTTFVGDVQVTFQPGEDGSVPLTGAAHGVRFDVLPSAGEAAAGGAEVAEEVPALGFLGLSANDDPSGRGLSVSAVDPDGRAFAAGMRRGDLIVEVDGVSVLSAADLAVRGGQRVAHVIVERSGRPLPPLSVDVEGLLPLGVGDVIGAASLVLLGCVLLAVPATGAGVLLRWLGRLAEPRRSGRSGGDGPFGIASSLMPPEGKGREIVAPALAPLLVVLAAFGWLALGHSLVTPDSDLLAIALGTAFALVVARAVDGVVRSRSAGKALVESTARALVCVLPAIAAVLGAVVASGRFVMAEMVADQGGAPWRWAGMRNPGLFVLMLLLAASAVPDVGAHGTPPIEGLPERPMRLPSTTRTVVRVVESAYLWTVCGLTVVLFLGGWRVPGVAAVMEERSRALSGLGAGLFLVKLWTVAAGVGTIRRRAGRVAIEHVAPLALRLALPAALFGLILSTAWTAVQDGLRSAVGTDFIGYVAVMLTAALLSYIAAAALRGRRNVASAAAVNPWL